MGSHQPIRKIVTPEIPDKLYFRIGDVAKLCDVPAYVLRFWETEFPHLKPNKGGTGQRLYRKRDVEMALRIKGLLYDQGYTIPGARQVFKAEMRAKELPVADASDASPSLPAVPLQTETHGSDLRHDIQLQSLRNEMRSLLGMLSKPASPSHPPMRDKVKTMRPRLMAVPAPAPQTTGKPSAQPGAKSGAKPVSIAAEPRLFQLEQCDLFGDETTEAPHDRA